MSRNPLTHFFKAAFAEAVSIDPELGPLYTGWKKSRRQFIRDLGLAAGSMALIPACLPKNKTAPEIVIVGAGMAGLNAAYQFNKKGLKTKIFEASSRTGGRMFTLKDIYGAGMTTDIGGEFVDTTHTDILQLAKELNISFYDLREDKFSPKTYYFGGKLLGQAELRKAISPYAKQIMKDIVSLPPVIDYTTADTFRHLDEQSITEYMKKLGINGWLYDFINVVLTREYGTEAKIQSAVNFLIMFVPPLDSEKDYELFGPGHEVFKIKGGSQQMTDSLFEKVKSQVTFNHRLTGIQQTQSGRYELSFNQASDTKSVQADYVLLTIPFSILRNIPFPVSMPAEKRKCIDEIGYGNSCKFILGVDQKPWRKVQQQGYTFTDHPFGAGWDSSQMQSPDKGSFTVFGGGDFGDYMNETPDAILKEKITDSLNQIFPSETNIYNNKNLKWCWGPYPLSKGGYSAFKKGQWSTLSGWEGKPVGNIFFAGEHVSKEFQGYMNGAAETARVAVEKMLSRMLVSSN
jgi:monoamine oxidase